MPVFFNMHRNDRDRQPARTLGRPAKQLMVVRKRTQPAAVYIARLTATATFAYLIALLVPDGTARPVLAPLTALLVLQASLFQTIRSAMRKVVSVTAGVLVAVTVSAFVGFSWWLLALLIGGTLPLGYLLRLGDDLLEVPISAMLIFTSAGEHAAASGLCLALDPGADAQLDRMAADLAAIPAGEAPDPARVAEWLDQTRALRGEIENVDDTLRQAEDSARLNPRPLRTPGALPAAEVALRGGLETLEHAAVTLRGLTRSMLDSSRTATEASPVRDEQTRGRLASVLTQLGQAIRAYTRPVPTRPRTRTVSRTCSRTSSSRAPRPRAAPANGRSAGRSWPTSTGCAPGCRWTSARSPSRPAAAGSRARSAPCCRPASGSRVPRSGGAPGSRSSLRTLRAPRPKSSLRSRRRATRGTSRRPAEPGGRPRRRGSPGSASAGTRATASPSAR